MKWVLNGFCIGVGIEAAFVGLKIAAFMEKVVTSFITNIAKEAAAAREDEKEEKNDGTEEK